MSGATFKNKADIERKVIECGGSVVQNPGNEFHLMNVQFDDLCHFNYIRVSKVIWQKATLLLYSQSVGKFLMSCPTQKCPLPLGDLYPVSNK